MHNHLHLANIVTVIQLKLQLIHVNFLRGIISHILVTVCTALLPKLQLIQICDLVDIGEVKKFVHIAWVVTRRIGEVVVSHQLVQMVIVLLKVIFPFNIIHFLHEFTIRIVHLIILFRRYRITTSLPGTRIKSEFQVGIGIVKLLT